MKARLGSRVAAHLLFASGRELGHAARGCATAIASRGTDPRPTVPCFVA